MVLVCNVQYRVTLQMPSGRWMPVALDYCGGSQVDDQGHYLSGGVWVHPATSHPNYRYFNDLPIVRIDPITK